MSYDIKWIPDDKFRAHIWDAKEKADLKAIDGFTRWVITGEDGVQYIVRPESSRKENE